MSQVTITLADTEDGKVEQTTDYGESFDKNSQAHQYSLVMIKLANDFMAENGTPNHAPSKIIQLS